MSDPHHAVRAFIEVERDCQLTDLEGLLAAKNSAQQLADRFNGALASAVADVISCEQRIQAFEAWLDAHPAPEPAKETP